MKRWLPAPGVSAGLFAMWLMLRPTLSPGSLLLGAALALLLPRLLGPLRPPGGRIGRPRVLARLVAHVAVDAVRSAFDVGRGVLRSRREMPRSDFVLVPLDLHDDRGLAVLAVITTIVPGTVWCELAADRSALRIHVFDLDDEAAFVAWYKRRYEGPLKEIFG